MPDGMLSDRPLIRSFSISFPIVMYSSGATTNSADCDLKKLMTSSKARAASSWEGDTGVLVPFMPPGEVVGRGGGCIEFEIWVGDTDIVSSMVANGSPVSAIGESSAVLLMYLGVTASDDAGGDTYCSTPTNRGNV